MTDLHAYFHALTHRKPPKNAIMSACHILSDNSKLEKESQKAQLFDLSQKLHLRH